MQIQSIQEMHHHLGEHPTYERLTNLQDLRVFMKYHVFAVWDFMSLLKALQREVTGLTVPWREAGVDPKLTRLVNEIVLGEESDLDHLGRPCSHFSLYLQAMEEVGADASPIRRFVADRDFSSIPKELADIVGYHLDVAMHAEVHEVAASFFYGRERVIPRMFSAILDVIVKAGLDCRAFTYYLKRHIELDSQEHGPMAMECLDILCDTDDKEGRARQVAIESLSRRQALWDLVARKMEEEHPGAKPSGK